MKNYKDENRRKDIRKILRVTKKMKSRTTWTFGFVSLAFLIVVGGLFYTYLKKGERYSQMALENRGLKDETIPFRRGEITDRNGVVLAKSEISYNIILDSKELEAEDEQ